MKFLCDCGTECEFDEGQLQSSFEGDSGSDFPSKVICKCCGKELE